MDGRLVISREHKTMSRHGRLVFAAPRVVALAALLQDKGPLTLDELFKKLIGRQRRNKNDTLVQIYKGHLVEALKPLGMTVQLSGGRYSLVELDV
jgi:hypothetical protein